MEWLTNNKEWLLSGIAVTVPIAIIGWLFFRGSNKKIMKQKGGKNSTNIQVGGDFSIKHDKENK